MQAFIIGENIKQIIRELILTLIIILVSVIIYHSIYGIDLSCKNYYDVISYDFRRLFLILEITGHFFLPMYLTVLFIRQIYFKFEKLYLMVLFVLAAVALILLLYGYYLFLGSENMVMAKEGWTIYPPLSGIPALDAYQTNPDQMALRNNQLYLILFVFILCLFVAIITVLKNRKKKKIIID